MLLFSFLLIALIWPCPGIPLLPGWPLDHPVEWIVIATGVHLWYQGKTRSGKAIPIILAGTVLAKVVLWLMAPPFGLLAFYYSNSELQGTEEASVDGFYLSRGTRVDRAIDFQGEDFPLAFMNARKYNMPQEERLNHPFSVRWEGYILSPRGKSFSLRLDCSGKGTIALPDLGLSAPAGSILPATSDDTRPLRFIGTFRRTGGDVPRARLLWNTNGAWEAVPGSSLFTSRDFNPLAAVYFPILARLWLAVYLSLVFFLAWPVLKSLAGDWATMARALDLRRFFFFFSAAVLLCMLYGFFIEPGTSLRLKLFWTGARIVTWLLIICTLHVWNRITTKERLRFFLVQASWLLFTLTLVLTLPEFGRTRLLLAGNDYLTFVAYAREIVLGGDILLHAVPYPFRWQVLFRYWLALCHLAGGDSLFTPYVLQGVLVIGSFLMLGGILRRLGGPRLSLAGTACFLVFITAGVDGTFLWQTRMLLSENLAGFLLLLGIYFPLVAGKQGRSGYILGGLAWGLAVAARANFSLFLPFVFLFIRCVSGKKNAAALLWFFLMVILILMPFSWRNYAVGGEWTLLPGHAGGDQLFQGNPPPPDLRLDAMRERPWSFLMQKHYRVALVLEYLVQRPGDFLANLARKAAFLAGWIRDFPSLSVFLAWILGLGGLMREVCRRASALRGIAFSFLGMIFTNSAVLVLLYPWIYGYRLGQPVIPLLLTGAAFLLAGEERRKTDYSA